MVKDLFRRYVWLVDVVYRAGRLTFEEINERWRRTEMSGGEDLPLKTFHNHRHAIADIFGIDIECNRKGGYYYYIENADDIEKGGVRAWLLNTFAVNNWYMLAHMPGSDNLRVYSLDRVESLDLTENKFVLPKGFDPEAYFYNSFGIIVYDGSPAETIRLKVYDSKRKYFRTLPLHHSQKEVEICEEYSIFEYFVSPTFDFQQEILSHGDEIEVLAPEHFRREVAEIVSIMGGYYQDNQ